MIHCGIDFEVMQVKFSPVESLDDFEDTTDKPVTHCPFCGRRVKDETDD